MSLKKRVLNICKENDCCELLDKCLYFKEHGDRLTSEGYLMMFCVNKYSSEDCYRKKEVMKTGKPVPANITPLGDNLDDM